MKVLALESSTSSAKALLYDTNAGLVCSAHQAYTHFVNNDPGQTDLEEVFALTAMLGRQVLEQETADVVALSGIWNGVGILDNRMHPLTPDYMWNYKGASVLCARLRRDKSLADALYGRTGAMVHAMYPRHVIQFLSESGMNLSDKIFMTQGGYNFFRLTGDWLESACMQSGCGFIGLESRTYDPEVLRMLGVSCEQFGTLAECRDTRPLSTEGARLLGLPVGTPVLPAFPDGALNQVGSGVLSPGAMTVSVGTSGALRVSLTKPYLQKTQKPWCYHGVKGWVAGAATAGACSCINWFMNRIGKGYRFEELDLDAGEMDVPVFLPFIYGERNPGWEDARTGGFVGLKGIHGVVELYRAVQMGVLFNLYQCYQVLAEGIGEPQKIVLSGGILNSALWTQMMADIFQKDVFVETFPDASLMGAVALGLYATDFLNDLEQFRPIGAKDKLVRANEKKAGYYETYYGQYLQTYKNLSGENQTDLK